VKAAGVLSLRRYCFGDQVLQQCAPLVGTGNCLRNGARDRKRVILKGDVPSQINPLAGLPFPPALSLRAGALPARGAGTSRNQTGPLGLLPPARRRGEVPDRKVGSRMSVARK
jgi:hypothetical protein